MQSHCQSMLESHCVVFGELHLEYFWMIYAGKICIKKVCI